MAVTSRKVPRVGSGPCTVKVIVAVATPKSPVATCVAVIVVVPKVNGVTVFDTTEATLGFDEVKVQELGEVEVGGLRLRLLTLAFRIVTSLKLPRTGATIRTVNIMEALATFQFDVLA